MAVQKANTDIADYLRAVLPDGGEHHDRCQRRAGFKRAGRWMGLGRAAGYIQDLVREKSIGVKKRCKVDGPALYVMVVSIVDGKRTLHRS